MAQQVWHILLWGRNDEINGRIKEGDIVDVIPATQWTPKNNETRLCLIVPVYGLSKLQAGILKEEGTILKRKYKIDFEALDTVKQLDKSAIRDEKRTYQPFLEEGILINMAQMEIVTDKNNEKVRMETIHLRI